MSSRAAIVGAVLLIAAPAAAGQTRCAALVDRDAKLRCYEAIDAELARATAEAAAPTTPERDEADEPPPRHAARSRSIHKAAVKAEVASATYTSRGVVFELSDQSRWRQIDNVTVRPNRIIGKAAKVKPGLVGGWLLEISGEAEAVRVTPVE